jgi:DNA-binding MltR family transcriptional regulator
VHFISTLATEGQRVAVIISAARLDYVLERILTRLMPPMKSAPDELFDTDRPLGSFAAKISLCHRLGLIDSELCRALTSLRKIRNDFSHSMMPQSLADSPHKERVNELVRDLRNTEFYESLSPFYASIKPKEFSTLCTAVAVLLSSFRPIENVLAEPGNPKTLLLLQPRGLLKESGRTQPKRASEFDQSTA